jgi:hypothetical protein
LTLLVTTIRPSDLAWPESFSDLFGPFLHLKILVSNRYFIIKDARAPGHRVDCAES